ncbi:hypothetical protein ACGVWS_11005 [Enterobacteriaceae bacterium LUAb1]
MSIKSRRWTQAYLVRIADMLVRWQKPIALIILGMFIGEEAQALMLTAVVQSGRSGIAGATAPVIASLSGMMDHGQDGSAIYGGISPTAITWGPLVYSCATTGSEGSRRSSTGVWGLALAGPSEGGVLLPDGTITWSRKLADGTTVTGMTTFIAGRWNMSWAPAVSIAGGPAGSASSHADGTYNAGTTTNNIMCPYPGPQTIPVWGTGLRHSNFNVRFLIDAPAGGLKPGTYTLWQNSAIHFSDNTGKPADSLNYDAADAVKIIAANYSCSLLTDSNALTFIKGGQETGQIKLTAQCSDSGGSAQGMAAWLIADAAGTSQGVSSNPNVLGVANTNGKLVIRASWSETLPNCTSSNVYFDGRDGVKLFDVPVNGISGPRVQPVSFRLCDTGAAPGNYAAQATFSIVQR